MNKNILVVLLALIVTLVVAQLPIFPYLGELREITEDGESLYQDWKTVPMPEFHDLGFFAKRAWRDSTRFVYYILFVINHLVLVAVYWFSRKLFQKILIQNEG